MSQYFIGGREVTKEEFEKEARQDEPKVSENYFVTLISNLVNQYKLYKEKKREKKRKKRDYRLSIYFGVPGTGKTTMAAYLTRKSLKKGIPVYSNVPIKGAYMLDKFDLGIHDLRNCTVIIDEAGVDFNNRDFKAMTKDMIYFLKYHRHYQCTVHVFSQSHEDMDITFRRLAYRYYVMKKSIIPGLITCRRIVRKIGIDQMTNQIADKYAFVPWWLFGIRWINARPLWKMFDSYNTKELKPKTFKLWDMATDSEKTLEK